VRRTMQSAVPKALAFVAILAALSLSGCAAAANPLAALTSTRQPEEIEPMLRAAGFESVKATTPAQQQRLKSLPSRQLGYYRDKNGAANYWLADADDCNCLFHGDEAAYQRYENSKLDQIAAHDRDRLEAQQQRQMPPGFGPGFGGPGFGGPGFGGPGFGGPGFGFGFGSGGFGFSL
jgi:hypothetical protein